MSKIDTLTSDWGFDDPVELMSSYITDSLCPAICMNADCNYSTEYEQDQTEGWCEECEEGSCKSLFELLLEEGE